MKALLISVDARETRVAILEENRLSEFYLERVERRSLVGNIYKGKVVNVLAGMDAAFVDIGLPKNGFLYVDDIFLPVDADTRKKRITQLVKPGQEIVVQVTKDPMGTKGPRLTTELSMAGRYLVYVPGGSLCGVSRRLADAERQRLRRLAHEIRPAKAGLIIRTVAEGVSESAIVRDLTFLEKMWATVQRRMESPDLGLVYSEAELALKIVRDLLSDEFSRILVDDEGLKKRIVGFLQTTTPELAERVEMYRGNQPLFEAYGVEVELTKALLRRADLPSGGYLVIDKTEAMTVIDVNTGRYVGRKFLEDTIVRTNLEACREIVRQLRVRDIGGIIIIDFIDMARRENREQVLVALQAELEKDRTKTYVVELSPLGLVEMTRQNVTDGIRGIMTINCPSCGGEGVIVSAESCTIGVERRLQALAESSGAEAFLVEVHASVARVLAAENGARARQLSDRTGRFFSFEASEVLPRDGFNVSAEGAKEVIARASLTVAQGQRLELLIDERNLYDARDGVGRLDGYAVCVAGAGELVGSTVRVVVDRATRNCAYGHVDNA
jgi:ribonuclease G